MKHVSFRNEKFLLVTALILVSAVALLACLFVYVTYPIVANYDPGFWINDPKNWERALGYEQPENVAVIHSQYWQSEHFSNEYEFFFKIQTDDAFLELLISDGTIVKTKGLAIENLPSSLKENAPKWFARGKADQYDIYAFKEYPENFRVLVNRETGEIYLADVQI